jgi:tetratricopeptide (TPR) repeat protein
MNDDEARADEAAGSGSERDPIDLLSEQFLQRHRRGEHADVEQFAAAHPDHAAALRELLPTLLALEQMKRERESSGSGRARLTLPRLERLGDFRIVREVGRGGMGVVFEAVQESLSRRVALKVLPQASLLTGNQLARFQREAQVAARLHHSNIVPVFGSGESDGYHWYAMQFIGGQGLDAWRAAEAGRAPQGSAEWRGRARFVASVGQQVASALHYAHGQGTLHRDVKPANLLLEAGGHVWVTDFGLAKALEAGGLTRSGDVLGTLQYMAPEQFEGVYDERSEVYALGITLHELAALRPAFTDGSRSELMAGIRQGRPPVLRRQCPALPDDLAIVIEKATAREPADRYASAELLEQDLQAFLEDRPIAARRHHMGALLVRWCRRNRALAGLAAVALFAFVAAAVTGWVAYVVTRDALAMAQTAEQAAKAAEQQARAQSDRAEDNLSRSLTVLGDAFDAIAGPDPLLLFDEDPDTGEQSVVALRTIDRDDMALLEQLLQFYGEFAAQNAESRALRFQTARAHWRIGVIHARFDECDEAAAAFDRALALFAEVDDRDVSREVAAVHLDHGHVALRRDGGVSDAATARYEEALAILEAAPAALQRRGLRFDRANVREVLANSLLMRRPPGGARRGGRPFEPDAATAARARELLAAALGLVDELLVDDAENGEARALKARCLLTSARWSRGDDAAGQQQRAAGLAILRELAERPGSARIRLDLCKALCDGAGPGGARQRDAEARGTELLEARRRLDELLAESPRDPEYLGMRARIGAELARYWLVDGKHLSEVERTQISAEAEKVLRATRAEQLGRLLAGDGDWQLLQFSIGNSGQLDGLLRRTGREAEAEALLEDFVATLRSSLQQNGGAGWPSRHGAFPGGPPGRSALGPGREMLGETFRSRIKELRGAGLPTWVLRGLGGLGERGGPGEPGDRRGGPPPEPRRNGR